MTVLSLVPGKVSLNELSSIYWDETDVELDQICRPQVEGAAARIVQVAQGADPVYGVNTGFGKLASHKIEPQDTSSLQRNLILSHCCGVGPAVPRRLARLMMSLKLLSFGRGASGVRWALISLLEQMLSRGVTPVIPAQGSVGASGDLAPLAHMTAVIIGEGLAEVNGVVQKGVDSLKSVGLEPVQLGPKEGLAFINGTQFSTAYALAGLFESWRAAQNALVISAASTDAIMGSTAPLQPGIHGLRGHRGQIEAASAMREVLQGSEIRESHRDGDTRVQDPYCIRCQPQVTGAAMDVIRQAAGTLEIEANAATDNPLILNETGAVVSGGNFHAEPVGFAADMIALAVSEIGAISQRRTALMVDPVLSFDLPPFLTPEPGLNSGLMIAEVTTAALMSENKHLANPCVTDSTPTSANQEDHVSMAAHGARRLIRMVKNLNHILGIELLCAAQGIEFRKPLKSSKPLQQVITRLRESVPPLVQDRYLAPELETAKDLVAGGEILRAVKVKMPELI
ncbi:histidine ammonia-lyase [Ruegeria arenilitoris]|uniref:histidine ammonia-lyase n=1 Tax=Ruegeria arenilitoris TaxID=1173585 RepID=UPI001479F8E8|nr:histidine ammonia-lyase [Ruegeria arenilitoris]